MFLKDRPPNIISSLILHNLWALVAADDTKPPGRRGARPTNKDWSGSVGKALPTTRTGLGAGKGEYLIHIHLDHTPCWIGVEDIAAVDAIHDDLTHAALARGVGPDGP